MRFILLSIRDRAADAFDRPFCAVSVSSGIRSFADAINGADPSSPLALHPEDFDLYHLGVFHDHNGSFDLLPSPVQVAIGKDLARPRNGG